MTRKQVMIMLLALVLGLGVTWFALQRRPGTVHEFNDALLTRNEQLDLVQFERAVETLEELDSQMIVMDALVNERTIEGAMSEKLQGYAGVSVRAYQYRDVAKQVVSRHAELFVPALLKRVREISRETDEVDMYGGKVWELPNGQLLIDYMMQLHFLVWVMSERRNEVSDTHHAVRLRVEAGNGMEGIFNSRGQSMSSTYGRIDPKIVGMGDNPKPLDNKVNLDAQIRIVVVNKQNIDELLNAIEAYAEKYFDKRKAKADGANKKGAEQ